MSLRVKNTEIGSEAAPFIIAEMSGNHNQSLERALAIVDAIAESGAHALKLQTYTPDTMTINLAEGEFFIDDPDNPWTGNSLYDLYKIAHTPWEWHQAIFERAEEKGLIAFSTPFDETAVDFLEALDVPAYKIASFENIDLKLIQKVAMTKKPMIISTGMASLAEIHDAVETARNAGCKDLILLKCTSSYPADPSESNLQTIPYLKQLFNCEVGLSDHTLGIGAAVASVALGANVIEKHFTLSRAEGGVDAAFSLEPAEFRALVVETEAAKRAMGRVCFSTSDSEKGSLIFRRSLYVCDDLEVGDALTPENLRAIRPGYGLPPKYLGCLLGKKVKQSIKRGTPMQWDLV